MRAFRHDDAARGAPAVPNRDARFSAAQIARLVRATISTSMPECSRRSWPRMRVLTDLFPLPVPIWLVCHRELRASRRIRLLYRIAEELARA